jgi:hypothetical protein
MPISRPICPGNLNELLIDSSVSAIIIAVADEGIDPAGAFVPLVGIRMPTLMLRIRLPRLSHSSR